MQEPEMPVIDQLKLYFEKHRFPITKIKKGSSTKKLQRWVIIEPRENTLRYYSKAEGGTMKNKAYQIDNIKFDKKRDPNGRYHLEIQPLERAHGPLTIEDPSVNITEVYNNIMVLKRNP